MSTIPWVYNSEIFPMEVRETALGITTGVNWMSNFLVNFIFPQLLEANHNVQNGLVWCVFVVIVLMNWAWTFCFMKETKGLGDEEIRAIMGTTTGDDGNVKNYNDINKQEVVI